MNSNIQTALEALEAERSELQQQLTWIDARIADFRAVAPPPAPQRSRARRVARRSNGNGANGREIIVAYLADHPGSTAGAVAAGTGLRRNSVSTLMTKLSGEGVLVKQTRGYAVA